MKRIWIILFCLFISAHLKSQIGFEYTIGNDECNQAFEDITVTNDNITFGIYNSFCPFDTNQIRIQSKVYKIGPFGDTLVFIYEKPDTIIQLHNIITTDEGNLLLAGEGYTPHSKYLPFRKEYKKEIDRLLYQQDYIAFQWYCLMTTNLEVIWERGFKNIADSLYTVNSVLRNINTDRNIYVANVKKQTNHWPYMYLFEFNNNGDSLYHKFFPAEETSKVYSITTSPNMEEIHLHKNYWEFGSPYSCSYLNMDTNFNSINTYIYPIELFMEPFYTMINNQSEFISFGYYFDFLMDKTYLSVIKFDTTEGLIIQNNLTPGDKEVGSPWERGIDYYYPDRIYVAGIYNQQIYPQEPNSIYVACLNNNLDLIHEQYINGADYFEIMAIEATPDGGVVIAGRVDNLQTPEEIYDAYLLKLDSSMFVGIYDEKNIKPLNAITVYPNPANELIYFKNVNRPKQIKIYNNHGTLIVTGNLKEGSNTLNISNLDTGIYIWVVQDDYAVNNGIFIKK